VEQGCREAMNAGILAGYPLVGIDVSLFDGDYHQVDSSELAFKIAGSMAFHDACKKANPCLMEPVMSVEITAPEHTMGEVLSDLGSRRGEVLEISHQQDQTIKIKAQVPLKDMFGYTTDLRSRTQGRATHVMEFRNYHPMPAEIQRDVLRGYGIAVC